MGGHPCYEGPEMLFLLLPIYADYLTGLIIKLNEYNWGYAGGSHRCNSRLVIKSNWTEQCFVWNKHQKHNWHSSPRDAYPFWVFLWFELGCFDLNTKLYTSTIGTVPWKLVIHQRRYMQGMCAAKHIKNKIKKLAKPAFLCHSTGTFPL